MDRNRSKERGYGRKGRVLSGVLLAVLLCFVSCLLWGCAKEPEVYQVRIQLKGEAHVTVGYGKPYTDPGAEAVGYGTVRDTEEVPLEVMTGDTVDTSKPGKFDITYTAEYQGITESVTRTVEVVDDVAPIIILTEDDGYTLPGQPYEEAGFSAGDEIDGDLTDKVERQELDGEIVYSVTDAAGNKTEVRRPVRYDDPVPPVLTLKGDTTVKLTVGDSWKDPGYTAEDNVDGDLTDKVQISGSVDTGKAGKYTLTYSVKDGYENEATAERTVVVEAPKKPPVETPQTQSPTDNAGKTIYLTFDDGPAKYTTKLLQVLEKYDVKATFFVVKTGYLDLLDDIVAGGHSIGIHSVSHDYKEIYKSDQAFLDDLYGMQDIIYEHTGVKTTLMRFPGGSSNGISKKYNVGIMSRLVKKVEELGFQYFDWNVNSKDAEDARTADAVYRNVVETIGNKKNSVVLQHDIKSFSVDAVEMIIRWGLDNGYTFAPLTPDSPACHHGVNN